MAAPAAPLPMRRTLRALSCRNFRLYFFGNLVSSIGTWIQLGAQSWLVLRLTDNGIAVGLILALQFLPVLVGGPWGGVIADRYDKRRVLLVTQAASVSLVGTLALVTLVGVAAVWMVLLAAFLRGGILLIEDATTEAFVGELVGPEDIISAVALNGAVSSLARIVGPAAAGVLTFVGGEGLCFLVNAVSYLAVVVALLGMDPRRLRRPERSLPPGGQPHGSFPGDPTRPGWQLPAAGPARPRAWSCTTPRSRRSNGRVLRCHARPRPGRRRAGRRWPAAGR